jgi:Bifunctional DNA primase/polymerase, N-terminal/Primase C terminal 1 (PriCT-1)
MPSTTIPSSLNENIFGTWQGEYAQRGLPTFPVQIVGHDKPPMTRGYHRTGLRGSTELTRRFGSARALGITLNQRRMIVDVDTTSESALADVLAKHGDTPLIARTASKGGYHCYFGENAAAWEHHKVSRRIIRPEAGRPIDYLGSGFAVVPPSLTTTGRYEFIRGSLDDINRLPPFRGIVPPLQPDARGDTAKESVHVGEGARNSGLFRACMKWARRCNKFDELLEFARAINAYYRPPLEEAEIMRTTKSVWSYTEAGQNRFGQHGAYFPIEEVATLLHNQDAFLLLAFLRAHNGPLAQFWVSNGLSETLGWQRKRFAAARQRLIELGHIKQIRPAFRHSPALFQWP